LLRHGPASSWLQQRRERHHVNKLPLASLLLAALLGGCVTKPSDIATYYHPMDGLRTDMITDNLLETAAPSREEVWLNASRVYQSHTRYTYYLEAIYAARTETGYLDIFPGATLVLVADGKELKFTGNGSGHLRKSKGGLLNETALYPVGAAELRAIGSAQSVLLRLSGRNGMVEREFKPVNRDRFRRFAEKFVQEK